MLKITKLSSTILIFYILFYQQVWGDNHLILYGTAGLTVISVIIYCIQTGYLVYERVPYGIWNNLILVFYAVGTGFFVAVDYMTTLRSSITLLAFAMVCIAICYASVVEKSLEWVLKVLVAVALLCSLYTLIRGTQFQNYGITMSATNNPHNLAAVLNLGIFSVIYLSRNRKVKFSLISTALILLFTIVTILCGSRKYLLANTLIEGIWAWAILWEGWKSKDTNRKIITAFMAIGIVGVAYYIIHNVYLGSGSQQRMQNSNDLGNQYRILFYTESWRIFLDHPIFGGGLNQFQFLSKVATGNYAHSTYAEAIADFGFVGCVLYFAPIAAVTHSIFRRVHNLGRRYGDCLLLAFCLAELFLGTVQIFFLEFSHFLAWSILFFYDRSAMDSEPKNLFDQQAVRTWKYIR